MDRPSSRSQQMAVHMALGFIPILKVRTAEPDEGMNWMWGRWRMASLADVVVLNSKLIETWRD